MIALLPGRLHLPVKVGSQTDQGDALRALRTGIHRLRRQTPAEVARWPVPPGPDFDAWCIIRRSDGETEVFALKAGETWDDHDLELELFFDQLRATA